MTSAVEKSSTATSTSTLRVLITNITMAHRTGTETYVRDLAMSLLKRGHTPLVYTTDPGQVSDELRAAGVPVVDDLSSVAIPPDVIHGHHHPETVTAMLRFPETPAIFTCHDRLAWHDSPPRFPRLLRYISVDDNCRDRLLYEHGISPDQIRVIPNSVDLERFTLRAPLPEQPRRALVFSNYARTDGALQVLSDVCTRAGISLDVVGAGVGKPCSHPESMLGDYDVVFAKARCALEALAVGASVILCHDNLLGPMVRTADLDRLRRLNLGRRTLTRPLHAEAVFQELKAFDRDDATEVTRRVRATAGLEMMVDDLLGLYRDVMVEARASGPDARADLAAAAKYLQRLAPFRLHYTLQSRQAERDLALQEAMTLGSRWRSECESLQGQRKQWEVGIELAAVAKSECERALTQAIADRAVNDQLRAELANLQVRAAILESQLATVHDSRTIRIRNRLLRIPLLQRIVHYAVQQRRVGT